MSSHQTITPEGFCARIKSGQPLAVLDVRTALEHKTAHIVCAHDHIPLDELNVDAWLAAHPQSAGTPLYMLCASGKRAQKAADLFAARGVQAVIVEGGLNACLAADVPVTRCKTVSLERQVRIAAGTLILTGAALGYAVNPAFYALCAAVGAGLVFAGVTDRCGLALLLAKMPWNIDRCQNAAKESMRKFERQQGAIS